ncbi:phenazine biosynthesis protein PhzF [Pseudoalteromonas sp. A601]|uniref:PhzF family phenazine biosynthesis protein n=1 Tax=Pseudoalteromonas sp. A601 TaxID=1967839 RepID=UPI000B3BDE0D|nr:PhzF family phenazine biosynthesis protein [Pseudoalteromonas sp. A601]OUS73881.1 phenazine biosynthesis protein PhzF [Pseudoalteromonas sp. A601]
MQLTIHQIDAFTSELFKGNYAAVIDLEAWLSDELMLKIGAENNVSETAFTCRQADGSFAMTFPKQAPTEVDNKPAELLQGLSIQPVEVLKNRQAYFAIYENEQDVFDLKTDSALLKTLFPLDVVATAPSVKYDFISRYFWPASGGDEDFVTGSIHTGLAPYWAQQLNKTSLSAYQASSRGGHMQCDVGEHIVTLTGHAVRYMQGTIFL